jgi:hypothetical protein
MLATPLEMSDQRTTQKTFEDSHVDLSHKPSSLRRSLPKRKGGKEEGGRRLGSIFGRFDIKLLLSSTNGFHILLSSSARGTNVPIDIYCDSLDITCPTGAGWTGKGLLCGAFPHYMSCGAGWAGKGVCSWSRLVCRRHALSVVVEVCASKSTGFEKH